MADLLSMLQALFTGSSPMGTNPSAFDQADSGGAYRSAGIPGGPSVESPPFAPASVFSAAPVGPGSPPDNYYDFGDPSKTGANVKDVFERPGGLVGAMGDSFREGLGLPPLDRSRSSSSSSKTPEEGPVDQPSTPVESKSDINTPATKPPAGVSFAPEVSRGGAMPPTLGPSGPASTSPSPSPTGGTTPTQNPSFGTVLNNIINGAMRGAANVRPGAPPGAAFAQGYTSASDTHDAQQAAGRKEASGNQEMEFQQRIQKQAADRADQAAKYTNLLHAAQAVNAMASGGTRQGEINSRIANILRLARDQGLPIKEAQAQIDAIEKELKGNSGAPAGATPPAAGNAPQAPAAGAVQGGYRFKGGNPADRNNWEKVS